MFFKYIYSSHNTLLRTLIRIYTILNVALNIHMGLFSFNFVSCALGLRLNDSVPLITGEKTEMIEILPVLTPTIRRHLNTSGT